MPVSNGSAFSIDCSDISGWTDIDTGEAVSSQVTFDSKSCFKFDSVTSADTDDSAIRYLDFGSVEAIGNRIVVSINIYCDAIGTLAQVDYFRFKVERSDWRLDARVCSDGLYIYNGTTSNEVGTDIIVQDAWQELTFDIDLSAGVANAVCDVYKNNVLIASDFDCSATGTYGDGYLEFRQYGHTTDSRISYVDWMKIGNSFVSPSASTTLDIIDPTIESLTMIRTIESLTMIRTIESI